MFNLNEIVKYINLVLICLLAWHVVSKLSSINKKLSKHEEQINEMRIKINELSLIPNDIGIDKKNSVEINQTNNKQSNNITKKQKIIKEVSNIENIVSLEADSVPNIESLAHSVESDEDTTESERYVEYDDVEEEKTNKSSDDSDIEEEKEVFSESNESIKGENAVVVAEVNSDKAVMNDDIDLQTLQEYNNNNKLGKVTLLQVQQLAESNEISTKNGMKNKTKKQLVDELLSLK